MLYQLRIDGRRGENACEERERCITSWESTVKDNRNLRPKKSPTRNEAYKPERLNRGKRGRGAVFVSLLTDKNVEPRK